MEILQIRGFFMSFKIALNNYIKTLECTSKELADSSNLSPSLISKYRNGDRKPKVDSVHIYRLVSGLCDI